MIIYIIIMSILLTSCSSNRTDSKKLREFQFSYNVELESVNGKKLELWIPIPQSNLVQTISNLHIDTQGLSYIVKEELTHSNKYFYIYSEYGLKESKMIKMTFDVKRQEHTNIIYDNINTDIYLKPSSMVPVGDIFETVIKNNDLNDKNIKGLYDFVLKGMYYGKPKSFDNEYYKEPWLTSKGKYGLKEVSRDEVVSLYQSAKNNNGLYTFGNGNSIYACDIGVGNCTDYHSYFISLNRTIGIPSRFHMGFTIPSEINGKIKGYHCWADYFVEGKGWFPVDISEADKNTKQADYFFGNVCENRVEMMVGRDFELFGYEKGKVNLFIYPIMEIDDKESQNFKKSFSYKNF